MSLSAVESQARCSQRFENLLIHKTLAVPLFHYIVCFLCVDKIACSLTFNQVGLQEVHLHWPGNSQLSAVVSPSFVFFENKQDTIIRTKRVHDKTKTRWQIIRFCSSILGYPLWDLASNCQPLLQFGNICSLFCREVPILQLVFENLF